MSLHPGDVITTGTPPGVGMGIKPEPDLPERRRCHGARHREAGPASARSWPRRKRTPRQRGRASTASPTCATSRAGACRARCSTTSTAARTTSSRWTRNRDDLRALQLRQRVMVDVSRLSLDTTVLGERWNMPVALAPTGPHRPVPSRRRDRGGARGARGRRAVLPEHHVHLLDRGRARGGARHASGSSCTSCATAGSPRR